MSFLSLLVGIFFGRRPSLLHTHAMILTHTHILSLLTHTPVPHASISTQSKVAVLLLCDKKKTRIISTLDTRISFLPLLLPIQFWPQVHPYSVELFRFNDILSIRVSWLKVTKKTH